MAARLIWRFFSGEDKRWRWQQMADNRSVVAESSSSYSSYDACIADAQAEGYLFEPAQGKLVRPGNVGYARW